MTKTWLLLVLIANCLFAESLFGQDQKPLEIPNDPQAAIAALPIAAPVKDGQVVTVIDGDTKKPIAKANVLIFPSDAEKVMKEQGEALQRAMQKQGMGRKQSFMVMAALIGTRYQTNAEGVVTVPASDRTFGLVLAGDRSTQWSSRMKGPVELHSPRFVTVQALNSRGKPARNVDIGINVQGQGYYSAVRGRTDATGHCKLELTERLRGNNLEAQALIATQKRIVAPFQADAIPDEPLQLQLPPCGQVRFILYGEDERPSDTLKQAHLSWDMPAGADFRNRQGALQPTQLDPDGAVFAYVGLNLKVNIAAQIKGLSEHLNFKAKGPVREHEMTIVDGRINVGPPIVSFRVLDQQGQPLANQKLGRVCYSERSFDYSDIETDKDGLVTVAFQNEVAESIYLLRRSKSKGSDYRGAARMKLDDLKPGKQTLADLQLLDEPVIASGTVVDIQGNPIAGLWLSSKMTIVAGGSGGGSSSGQWWYHRHRVRTDEKGHFEIREVAAVDNALRITLEGDDWAPLGDDFVLNPGDTNQVLRVGAATQLQGEFVGDMEDMRVDVKAIHRETKKETRGSMHNGKYTFAALPEGHYDLVFGRNGVYTIEDVKSVKKGQPQDARLKSDEWKKHFQVLETTVTDESDKPLENVTVWYYVVRKNGRSGSGLRTDKFGKTRRLSPIKDAAIEVKQPGYEARKFDKDLQSLTIKLSPIAPIEVEFAGLPKMADQVFAQATISNRGALISSHGGVKLTDGKASLQPTMIGKGTMTLSLGRPYQHDLPSDVRRAVSGALRLKGLTFDVVAAREAGEKMVIKLDEDVIEDIQACLDDVREILKNHKEGK